MHTSLTAAVNPVMTCKRLVPGTSGMSTGMPITLPTLSDSRRTSCSASGPSMATSCRRGSPTPSSLTSVKRKLPITASLVMVMSTKKPTSSKLIATDVISKLTSFTASGTGNGCCPGVGSGTSCGDGAVSARHKAAAALGAELGRAVTAIASAAGQEGEQGVPGEEGVDAGIGIGTELCRTQDQGHDQHSVAPCCLPPLALASAILSCITDKGHIPLLEVWSWAQALAQVQAKVAAAWALASLLQSWRGRAWCSRKSAWHTAHHSVKSKGAMDRDYRWALVCTAATHLGRAPAEALGPEWMQARGVQGANTKGRQSLG
eukprot:scaffold3678_cov355-Prasinococcus_capsulatus_cf.AAC.7